MLMPNINDLNTKYVYAPKGAQCFLLDDVHLSHVAKVFILYLSLLNVGVYSRGQEEEINKNEVTSFYFLKPT